MDREAFDLQQSSGISHKDALLKAGPRKQLLCTVCERRSMEDWPPPCSSRGQVLKNKQKDNLRAGATYKDSRNLQAVRFKVREEMRPGHLSWSSSSP